FRKEVLRDDRKTLGRYDMRFEGVDLDAAGENPSYDASDVEISGAFVGAFHDYLERELKYQSTDAYRPTAKSIGQWDWKLRPTATSTWPRRFSLPSTTFRTWISIRLCAETCSSATTPPATGSTSTSMR